MKATALTMMRFTSIFRRNRSEDSQLASWSQRVAQMIRAVQTRLTAMRMIFCFMVKGI